MRIIFSVALLLVLVFSCPGALCLACASFCLDTRDGPIFGTNLDLHIGEGLVFANKRGVSKEGYQAGPAGEVAQWTFKYGSLTFNLVGREFAWCGMNEAGLVVSTMWLEQSGLPAPDEEQYDHDVNLAVLLNFCEKWGFEISQEDAEEFTIFLESFPCVM